MGRGRMFLQGQECVLQGYYYPDFEKTGNMTQKGTLDP